MEIRGEGYAREALVVESLGELLEVLAEDGEGVAVVAVEDEDVAVRAQFTLLLLGIVVPINRIRKEMGKEAKRAYAVTRYSLPSTLSVLRKVFGLSFGSKGIP